MNTGRIADLLNPFLGGSTLTPDQLANISMYIDILLHWNARINLTAVREPEEIVARHFGESFFAARLLLPQQEDQDRSVGKEVRVLDVGSGAGFPGMPIKICAPHAHVTLVESNHKKATFLKEVARSLRLTDIDVFARRAEELKAASADLVTLRAVEKFEAILPVAAALVGGKGRLAILIGESQASRAAELVQDIRWQSTVPVPNSIRRVLLIGDKEPKE